jgi:hypothetical protein
MYSSEFKFDDDVRYQYNIVVPDAERQETKDDTGTDG